MSFRLLLSLLFVSGIAPRCAVSAERVDIVVGADAGKLERFAADELAGQFRRLFDAEIAVANSIPARAKHVVLIGSPKTNPAIQKALGNGWPKLSDQGIALESFQSGSGHGLAVGGGSPAATLWAVYELGHRLGIRYMLREDIFPAGKIPLKLDGFQAKLEPSLRTRTWRTINDFAIGPESWGLKDHQRLLRQLAKLKFNRVMLSVYPWQPFVHYEFRGVKKQTGLLWYGERYRVDGDTPGRVAFGGAKFFENPDFAGAKTYQQRIAAGVKLARGIIETAHDLGMSVGLSISPLEFPKEFAAVLPGARKSRGLKNLLIAPGGNQRPDDPVLTELVSTKIRAYLKTYPGIDALYLTLPEFPEWDQHAEAAWKQLDSDRGLGELTLDRLTQTAAKRKLIASSKRGVRAVKSNLVTLAFLNRLFDNSNLLKRKDGQRVELVITGVDPALFSVLDRVIPQGAGALHFVDYTARRIVENQKLLADVPAKKVRSSLILTLADDNIGLLPQSATQRIHTLVSETRRLGWDGFSTRYWVPAELDPTVHYLSRAAYDPTVTPRSAHDDLFVAITGSRAASDRLWKCFVHLEQATELIDRHALGLAFPVEGMLMKHHRAEPLPDWWKEMTDHYTQSMIELYRSHGAARSASQKILFYYAKRGEYVLDYLGCIQALRESAIARKKGDNEKAVEEMEKAVEAMYNCMDTLSDVIHDPSDRGLIAVLNAHAYRPLVAEYEKLLDATEEK